MSIDLKPIKAQRIDLSNVEDFERERLRIVFENGKVLYFRLSTDHLYDYAARLVLDHTSRMGPFVNHFDSRNLFKQLFLEFKAVKVERTWFTKLKQGLRKFSNPNYVPPFAGWTYEQLWNEFEVELRMGDEWRPSGLGEYLVLHYGTRNGGKELRHFFPGKVKAVDSITLEPISLKVPVT